MLIERYKLPCLVNQCIKLDMQWNATILSVQKEAGEIYLWALIDPESEIRPKEFLIAETGVPIEHSILMCIGTIQHQWKRYHIFLL